MNLPLVQRVEFPAWRPVKIKHNCRRHNCKDRQKDIGDLRTESPNYVTYGINFPSVSVEIIILPPLCFSVLFDTYEEFPKKPCRCQVDLEIGSKTEAK